MYVTKPVIAVQFVPCNGVTGSFPEELGDKFG